jgi:predicted TIM-barrel fold metal-dependent hydrolase
MIIDCHTHLNNYHDDTVVSLQRCLNDLRAQMRLNRIDVALVLTSYKVTPGRPSTLDVVSATREMPDVFVVAGVGQQILDTLDHDQLRRFMAEGSVRGIKIYPGYEALYPSDPCFGRLFDLAAEMHLPVMIHCGDTFTRTGRLKYAHPLNVDDAAVDHPDVNFVICHLGTPWFRDTMEVVYKNDNVFTDISGLVLGDFNDRYEGFIVKQLQEMLVYGVEPDKVLFGTDWPISSIGSYLEFMDGLPIPERDRDKIMYANAARLFDLTLPGNGMGLGSLLEKLR